MRKIRVNLMEKTLKEIKEEGKIEVVVLPWGSCEPHNLHLPYGTDTFSVEKVAELSAIEANKKGGKIIVLPTIPIGTNSISFGFPMTLHLATTTQIKILEDILRALEKHKIYKLVLFNGHGGNRFEALMKEVYGLTKVHIFLFSWWTLITDLEKKICKEFGSHATEAETSWMMYLYPELVHPEWADKGKVREPKLECLRDGSVYTILPWHIHTTNSGAANPNVKETTKEKGEKLINLAVKRISKFLVELSKSKIDKNFPC